MLTFNNIFRQTKKIDCIFLGMVSGGGGVVSGGSTEMVAGGASSGAASGQGLTGLKTLFHRHS